jgi:hypothetical protein
MDEYISPLPGNKLDRNSTEEKIAFQERMSQARKIALGDRSPREVGELRIQKIVQWVHAFEKSTIPILERVGGSNQYGRVKKLIERGLLRVQNSKAGGFDGVPKQIVTLTLAGLDYAERHSEEMYRYRWAKDPSGLNQNHLLHDLIAQVLTISNLQEGRILGFEPESRYSEKNQMGKKKPDVIWLMPEEKRWGLEVELTKKTGRDAHTFVSRVVDSLTTENLDDRIDAFLLVTDKPGIEKAYKAAMAVGSPIVEYRKDSRNRWMEIDSGRRVPKSVEGRFMTICKEDFFALLRTKSGKGG